MTPGLRQGREQLRQNASSAIFQPTGPQGDKVEISELASVMTDRAAGAFEAMGKGTQDFLKNLVGSGQISAKEVAAGLDTLVAQAAFDRFVKNRPKDSDDLARLDRSEALNAAFAAQAPDPGPMQERRAIHAALRRGEIDQAEYQKRMAPVLERMTQDVSAFARSVQDANEDRAQLAQEGFQKNLSMFSEVNRGKEGEALRDPYDPEGIAATHKLASLGFTRAIFGNALDRPAATSSDTAAADRAAVSVQEEARSMREPKPSESLLSSAQPSSPSPEAATAPHDPTNSAAALKMLQSALEAGGAPKTGFPGQAASANAEPGGALKSLMDALKAGVAKPLHDETV